MSPDRAPGLVRLVPVGILALLCIGALALTATRPRSGARLPGGALRVGPGDPGPTWRRFAVEPASAGSGGAVWAEAGVFVPPLAPVAGGDTAYLSAPPGEALLTYEAELNLVGGRDLVRWLDYESMLAPALTPEDRAMLVDGLLLAEVCAAALDAGDAEFRLIHDFHERLVADARAVARVRLRQVLYISGAGMDERQLERRARAHLPKVDFKIHVRTVAYPSTAPRVEEPESAGSAATGTSALQMPGTETE